jgi:hypothetical protein
LADSRVKIAVVETNTARLTPAFSAAATTDGTWPNPIDAT